LSKAGYIDFVREQDRSIYSIETDLPLHLPFQRDMEIRELLGLLREHNG
jgi:hypothetical protein